MRTSFFLLAVVLNMWLGRPAFAGGTTSPHLALGDETFSSLLANGYEIKAALPEYDFGSGRTTSWTVILQKDVHAWFCWQSHEKCAEVVDPRAVAPARPSEK